MIATDNAISRTIGSSRLSSERKPSGFLDLNGDSVERKTLWTSRYREKDPGHLSAPGSGDTMDRVELSG
jgi:hypothetical protein